MWKAFSRSVCEVVERRVGFTAFRSDVASRNRPDTAKPSSQICFVPQLKTYCPLKHLRASRSKQTSHEHTGKRQHQQKRNDAKWNDPSLSACLGAMGWSTALVLGWYLSHPLGRHLFGDSHFKERRLRSAAHDLCVGRIVHAQSPVQPLGIRPLTFSPSTHDHSFHSSVTSSGGEGNEPFTHQRGPFTPEEALDEVSRVFEEASRTFSGDVENKLGTVCMTQGRHSEAMKHFRRASHHQNAVAAYNMGQCYELGLGTTRNLRKAAKWYKISSDRGHPTAMYNLAVFQANGWGGLHEDQNRAHELLVLAANLGLKEAKDALKTIGKDVYASNSDQGENRDPTEEFLELIGATSRRVVKAPPGLKLGSQTHLSHLDWLDLGSSTSLSSPTSEEILNSMDESHLYSGLSLESDWSHSSSSRGKIVKIKDGYGRTNYYIMDRAGSISSGESLDEATNCRAT